MVAKRVPIVAVLLGLVLASAASAHTMFLKLESFFLEPDSSVEVELVNGDFDLSENVIARDRMVDVSLLGPSGRTHPPESAWRSFGKDR